MSPTLAGRLVATGIPGKSLPAFKKEKWTLVHSQALIAPPISYSVTIWLPQNWGWIGVNTACIPGDTRLGSFSSSSLVFGSEMSSSGCLPVGMRKLGSRGGGGVNKVWPWEAVAKSENLATLALLGILGLVPLDCPASVSSPVPWDLHNNRYPRKPGFGKSVNMTDYVKMFGKNWSSASQTLMCIESLGNLAKVRFWFSRPWAGMKILHF